MDQNEESPFKCLESFKSFCGLLRLKGQKLIKMECSHIMILYFIVHGLEVIDHLQAANKQEIVQYVLDLEIKMGGFSPSSLYIKYQKDNNKFNLPHIVFTYSALNILKIFGEIDKIDKQACLESVKRCQKQDGSYSNFENSSEADLRFVYSAVAICHLLHDFSRMNVTAVVKYIQSCQNFDGGFGLRPHCESHSGAIYCALASLKLLEEQKLLKNSLFDHKNSYLLNFLVNRQISNASTNEIVGIQGRVGKLPDSCYSFWVGASIKILTQKQLLSPKVSKFLQICYKDLEFGFSKYPTGISPDPFHTMQSLVGIKILKNEVNSTSLAKGVMQR